MSKNNFLLFFISISFFLFNVYSKRCNRKDICKNEVYSFFQKNSEKSTYNNIKDEIKYFQKDKIIKIKLDKLKLHMNFTGIYESESGNISPDFKVIYTANFYDKEKLGIDEIKAELQWETPLYNYSIVKIGEETKDKINWVVNINKNEQREQIVQVKAEAILEDNKEVYIYNSFIFKYSEKKEENKNDKTLEFWLIFIGFIGMIILTFGVFFVYFYATIEIGRNTLMLNNISTGLESSLSSQDRETKQNISRTTT